VQGRRLLPNADGYLPPSFEPGDYGRATNAEAIAVSERHGWWQVCAPDGSNGSLNPRIHAVTEHEDGTITVSPSIDFSQRRPGAYHGFLVRGVWRGC
jgi:hypothetical protein